MIVTEKAFFPTALLCTGTGYRGTTLFHCFLGAGSGPSSIPHCHNDLCVLSDADRTSPDSPWQETFTFSFSRRSQEVCFGPMSVLHFKRFFRKRIILSVSRPLIPGTKGMNEFIGEMQDPYRPSYSGVFPFESLLTLISLTAGSPFFFPHEMKLSKVQSLEL